MNLRRVVWGPLSYSNKVMDVTKILWVAVNQIEPYSLVEAERDYPSICKRYSKLYVVPEFSKVWS